MEKCKVCDAEFKKITVTHIRTHGLEKSDYDALPDLDDNFDEITAPEVSEDTPEVVVEEVVEEVAEPVEDGSITPEERTKHLFEDEIVDSGSKPLSIFLAEFNITERELRNIVKRYKGTNAIPVSQQIENAIRVGDATADELSTQNNVETFSLNVAESLVKKHNFNVVTVRGPKNGKPKTWILEK